MKRYDKRVTAKRWGAPTALIVTAGLALGLSACGGTSSSTSASQATSSTSGSSNAADTTSSAPVTQAKAALASFLTQPTKINITTPLKSKPAAGKTIVVLGTTDPANVLIQHVASQVAAQVHWNYAQVSYDPANIGTFNAAVDTALAKHANYIVESGIPLTPTIEQKVKAAGAKFVLGSVYPASVTPPVIVDTNTTPDFAVMAKELADFFIADSNGHGHAVVEHVPSYPILDGFTNAFAAAVASGCPACSTKTVNVTIPQVVAGTVPSTLVSALRSDSSANYLVFDDGNFATGITSALAAAGLASKVKVIGDVTTPGGIAALKNGTETAWTGFDPSFSAYQLMDAAFRDSEGMPIDEAQEGQEPTQLVTKANVGSITNWSYPTNSLQQFETLWHLS
jgi:ribose transport system substrate-binding protein